MSTEIVTAKEKGMAQCKMCHLVFQYKPEHANYCPRCDSFVEQRINESIQKCWAWTICSMIAAIPANTFPIMTVLYFGKGQPDTILSGIILLLKFGMYPIAAIVFIASFIVPLAKIGGLFYLLYSLKYRTNLNKQQRTDLYRYIELLGKWSMLDVFVVSLMVTLVEIGNVIEINAGAGATAFGIMVVLTMFAAHSFDPRLLWDQEKPESQSTKEEKSI
ncbi:paraquat-inducible protein A [Thalassotalea sp. Y01]|uniref:paraquat-inducible protein A n=1 Tax=Thalassotalea sp. Y01 TaxID=2729613 RepID=UPI00145FD061|nr:paraquat-inducible protein A [Thalassotalea sp. Y01]NMP15352.1 paraquat-inducible membrane protein A [Thalassotalea sp. Y01]